MQKRPFKGEALRTKPERHVRHVAFQKPDLPWTVRLAFYAFIFSVPFGSFALGSHGVGFTLGSLVGIPLAVAILPYSGRWLRLPAAFWGFAVYLSFYLLWSLYLFLDGRIDGFGRFLTLCQLLLLFLFSKSLLENRYVADRAVWLVILACLVIAVLQLMGIGTEEESGRVSLEALSANSLAVTMTLGLLLLIGLVYGGGRSNFKLKLFSLLYISLVGLAVVRTGSRGPLAVLLVVLPLFTLMQDNLSRKLKIGSVAVVAFILLVCASLQIETVRVRWERTLYKGDVSGRMKIYDAAWEMFLERPIIGWGPVRHAAELGSRLGLDHDRSTHNLYLWLLVEMGVLGFIPFCIAIGLCVLSAWHARKTIHGRLALVAILFYLVNGIKGNPIYDKLLWVILAYSAASGSYAPVRRLFYAPNRPRANLTYNAVRERALPRGTLPGRLSL